MTPKPPIVTAISTALMIASCAVPVAPTGGPTDAVPPALLEVQPPDGATNVSTEQLRFTFNEYISDATFARAFSITPEPDRPPEISWRRRTVTVRLRTPLRENTTYRITIDRELRDVNNVAVQVPIVTAFSTGPTINRAALKGTIIDGLTGEGVRGIDVFAYLFAPGVVDTLSTLPARPLYRTQTDDQGHFELTYLSEGGYFVLGVDDRNGNRLPDDAEFVALPDDPVAVASDSAPDSLVMFSALNDSAAPTLRRAAAVSSTRFELIFSERIFLGDESGDTAGWTVTDSITTFEYPVEKLFVSPSNNDRVVLVTESPQDAPQPDTPQPDPATQSLRLTAGPVRDSLGNSTTGAVSFVAASRRADTTRTRLLGIRPAPAIDDSIATLSPNEHIVVTLNQSAKPDLWLSLVDPNTTTAFAYTWGTADGRSYRIEPALPVGAESFLVRVHAGRMDDTLPADSVVTQPFRRLRAGEVGEISGVVRAEAGDVTGDMTGEISGNIFVHVFSADDPSNLIQAAVGEGGAFRVTGLRPGRYVLRTFLDLDGNGRWTPTTFPPYVRGEPIRWVTDSLEVRTRFETILPDTVIFTGG